MQARAILQTIGTVSSLIMAYITLRFTHNLLTFDIQSLKDVLLKYPGFLFAAFTVAIMVTTGLSYFNSRLEYHGKTRFLYLLVALAHILLGPAALFVAIMKINFGQYWWAVLIGFLILIYWGSQQKESQN